MNRFLRQHIALFLILVYGLGMAAPLASLAFGSAGFGKQKVCAGDCRLCGCAPARSASRTCCCFVSQKKVEADHEHEAPVPDCCADNEEKTAVPVCSNAPCGVDDELLKAAESDPTLAPCRPRRPRVAFLEDELASPPFHRPAERYRPPPEHPPRLS